MHQRAIDYSGQVGSGQSEHRATVAEAGDRPQARVDKPHGGCLLEIDSGEVVTRGVSMPHSPRVYEGLWLLESGTGQLLKIDATTGQRQTVTCLPGFTRGLAIRGPYAFVGLSRIRETSAIF